MFSQIKLHHTLLSIAALSGALLLAPDRVFANTNVEWPLGLFLFPVFVLLGLLVSVLHSRKNDPNAASTHFIQAWMAFIGGIVALPLCLIIRPSVAQFAFLSMLFGLGPMVGFYIHSRFK